MLSLLEIEKLHVNPAVAREAFEQASARLADILDTKKAFEQKAFTLFSGYLTVAIAVFGVGGAIYKGDQAWSPLAVAFLVAGALFVLGSILFMLALHDSTYGALASSPDMWLNAGTIDGDATVLPRMLAYITFYHQDRIDTSTRANNRKAACIRWGIYAGVAAPFAFLFVAYLCTL